MRWRTVGTDTELSNPTNDTQAESIGRIILQWSDTTVTPANQGYAAYGCGCGPAATRKAKGACREWGSLRIDAQRKSAIGKKDPVTFNAYNIQFGTGSYAAVNIRAILLCAWQTSERRFKEAWHSGSGSGWATKRITMPAFPAVETLKPTTNGDWVRFHFFYRGGRQSH